MSAESRCRWCGEPNPPKKPTGRPAEFCSRQHRRAWHVAKERLARMIEHRERGIDEMHGMEREWYGKREADREARRRRKELEAKIAEWDRELWTPGAEIRP